LYEQSAISQHWPAPEQPISSSDPLGNLPVRRIK
jgi:hypothetical protein